jgi:hypothetical protein
MIERLGGRKMVLALLSVLVGAALYIAKGNISTEMVALLLGVVGAFNLGNVAATKIGSEAATAEAVAASPPPPAADTSQDLMAISQQIEGVQATVSEVAQATALNQQGLAAILQIAQGRPRQ